MTSAICAPIKRRKWRKRYLISVWNSSIQYIKDRNDWCARCWIRVGRKGGTRACCCVGEKRKRAHGTVRKASKASTSCCWQMERKGRESAKVIRRKASIINAFAMQYSLQKLLECRLGTAEKLMNEPVELPQDVFALQELCLQYREEVIQQVLFAFTTMITHKHRSPHVNTLKMSLATKWDCYAPNYNVVSTWMN